MNVTRISLAHLQVALSISPVFSSREDYVTVKTETHTLVLGQMRVTGRKISIVVYAIIVQFLDRQTMILESV